MDKNKTYIDLSIDKEDLDKIQYISKYYGYSLENQIITLIDNYICKYEKKHGIIVINREEEKWLVLESGLTLKVNFDNIYHFI